MIKFTTHTLLEIFSQLQDALSICDHISFEVLNPDISTSSYAGEVIKIADQNYTYHSFKAWCDLAEILHCRICTPVIKSESTVVITYKKLDKSDSFHSAQVSIKEEKYGVESKFFHINKNEEPSFFYYYLKALKSVKVCEKKSILNLGINRGDEFEMITKLCDETKIDFYGVDHSISAINEAKKRFFESNFHFFAHDINALKELNLPRFDLIITIGTLQSSSLNFNKIFMEIVQNYLSKEGAIILGFPNCRWIDGEMIYGAKAPNYADSELSLMIKDIYFCKKYLQQHKFRVTISGESYLFLSATRIGG